MSKITDFQHPEDSSFVGWMYAGIVIKKDFSFKIHALLLKDEKRVIVIELKKEKNNAIIFNADGSTLKRVLNPDEEAICFSDVYYINSELTLINRRNDASMSAVVVDEYGEIVRVYETR